MPTHKEQHKSKIIESFMMMTDAYLVLLDRCLEHLPLNSMKYLKEKINKLLDKKIDDWEKEIDGFIDHLKRRNESRGM